MTVTKMAHKFIIMFLRLQMLLCLKVSSEA